MDIDIKIIFSVLGLSITLSVAVYYINLIRKGKVVPHAFTWLVWFVITAIAFYAQLKSGGGPGSWVTALIATHCLLVSILGFLKKSYKYTKFDFFCLLLSLSAIPIWLFTKTPLYAVVLVSVIDFIAILPTYRVGWQNPYIDSAAKFTIDNFKLLFSIFALGSFSLTTVLYPASAIFTNSVFVIILLYRRKVLGAKIQVHKSI